jgi:hypothetical protein
MNKEVKQGMGLECVVIRIDRAAANFDELRDAALRALHPQFLRHAELEKNGREFALYIG